MNVYPGYYRMFSSIPDFYPLNTPVATPRAVLFCGLLTQSCPTLCNPMGPTGLLCPKDSPGKNTGVGCHALLPGIFPTQGSNPGKLEWVAYPFSGHLTDPGIKPGPPALQADSLPALLPGKPSNPLPPTKNISRRRKMSLRGQKPHLSSESTLDESACTECLQECILYPDRYGETSIFLWSPYLYYRYIFLSGNFSFCIKINIAKLIYVFEGNLEKEIHKHSLEIATVKSLMHFLGVNAY